MLLSILPPDTHHEHGAKVIVKVKPEGQGEDVSVVRRSDSFFPPCSDSSCCPLPSTAASTRLYPPPSPLPPLLHSPAWLAGSPMLLSFSSTPPLSVPLKLPLPVLDTLASSVSLCNAASLQQAWGLLDRSPLSSPPLCLAQSTLYGLIYLPSLPPLPSPYSEAELLTSCRVHDHSWAGSLRQTAVEN